MSIKVFDFFSGCGGASKGFQQAGLEIVLALDNDPAAADTFAANFKTAHFVTIDIASVSPDDLEPFFRSCEGSPVLFSGCAPCQPFTKQNTKPKDADVKRTLLGEFQRFVEYFEPELVFVENVPGMQKVEGKNGPFDEFVKALKEHGYYVEHQIVASQNYGVPQMRRRLILIASRLGPISFPSKDHGPGTPHPQFATVKEWIGSLPSIEMGETHPSDPIHRAAHLSELNLRRIQALSEGQDRTEWADPLKLRCHTNGYNGHTDVYGRMWWNKPATGLTTRCISLSNGRFGHPEQDRAISVREAARLQTFPMDFVFKGNLASMARQIGNAVPVLLAQRFGEHFNAHIQECLG